MTDIATWLDQLGLAKYAPNFSENELEPADLSELSDDDLREMGLPLGPRRRILKAIRIRDTRDRIREESQGDEGADAHMRVEAERRQLTVMFCDLVGSTALSQKLDPEEYREIIQSFQKAVSESVRRFDGYVAKYLGDGVLVYFGYPRAEEDDAELAVRGALASVSAVGQLNGTPDDPLQARVGIATGLVVAGDVVDGGVSEVAAISGPAPNLAARLQTVAAPGCVVIDETTYGLIKRLLKASALGQQVLKGISEPVAAWHVSGIRDVESRFEGRRSSALATFVGRDREMHTLIHCWNQARMGEGQVVTISGEPGIGKSRLTEMLHDKLAESPHIRLRYQCSPHHTNSALYPVIAQLTHAAAIDADDPASRKLDKLETLLRRTTKNVDSVAGLFADLLSIPHEGRYAPHNLTPQARKKRTLEALRDQLLALSEVQPVLMVFEDLHWVDPTTRELLDLIVARTQDKAVLMILTFRPEFQAPWVGQSCVTLMTLSRLAQKESITLVRNIAANTELDARTLDEVAAMADGVPLFIEELTRALVEGGTTKAIPATIQALLLARLDRLGPAKKIAQIGAVIGREFGYRLVEIASKVDKAILRDQLDALTESQLIVVRGAYPNAIYTFKHALIQDAAYESLLKSSRRELHHRIGTVLEDRFPRTVDVEPEILAHHYAKAGLTETAVFHWHKAGRRAIERSANVEAISHLTEGIALLGELANTEKRNLQELDLQMALGTPLMLTKGFAAPEVERTFSRALELSEQVGETSKRFSALWGVNYCYSVRSPGARPELPEQVFHLAQSEGDQTQRLVAHRVLGSALVLQARFTEALELLQQGLTLYDPEQHRSLAYVYGQDLGVVTRQWTAWALWFLGYPDQALSLSRETAVLAREISHPLTDVYIAGFTAIFHRFRREAALAGEIADKAAREAAEQGFGLFLTMATVVRGSLLTEGSMDDGIALLQDGLTGWRNTGAELFVPFYLALLAKAHCKAGQTAQGLAALDEAQIIADKGGADGERLWDAELSRIKGELLLGSSDPDQAEMCFQKALQIARSQRAKSWELRASVSLCLLWKSQGRRTQARELLQEIYDWFSEGFDTPDLLRAKALLEDLN
ncbi:AAA family ATPase [Rhodobacteraceae bacterium M382]|nr:AAA family ATPase [Rhodobacteraceae bacterium M382]